MSDGLQFTSGDLVKVLGTPPAFGEVIGVSAAVGRVRVRFQNGAWWLNPAHLELVATSERVTLPEGVTR